MRFSAESGKKSVVGNFSNLDLKLNTTTSLSRKEIWKLDVNGLVRKNKYLSPKLTLLSSAETSVDQTVAI